MKIFVTGATGVIGRRALPLLTRNHAVTAGVRDEHARARLTAAGVQCAIVDLFDQTSLERAMRGHDVVINLATHIPNAAWKIVLRRAWAENDRIRSEGVRNLVAAARTCSVTRFIQESYAPVYPDRGDEWIGEGTPLAPSKYNRTVIDAETSVESFADGPRTGVVLRFAAFYGPDALQLHAFIRGVRHGWAAFPGGAENFISSVSHDDAARAVVAALAVPSGPYNVTDDEPLRRADYVAALAAALGVPTPRFLPAWTRSLFGPAGDTLVRSQRISNRRLTEATGWLPHYPSVREGFVATVAELAAAQPPKRHLAPSRP
jgi:nucleoside-diphosphate-sugar epimerase